MNERNQIIILLIITLGIAGVANFAQIEIFEGDAVATEYSAIFYSDNILEETFTYKINVPGKKFLFRFWEDRLVTSEASFTHIELVDILAPTGTIRYAKDYTGSLTLLDESDVFSEADINRLAYRNEAGAYNPLGYEPGEYRVTYIFRVVPPLEYDEEYVHLNLKLASEHIPYKKVKVSFENPGYIVESYPHPPTMRKSTDKNMIVFTGSSGEDELLEFEFLMSPDALDTLYGIPRQVDDIKKQTVDANRMLSIEYTAASILLWSAKLAGFAIPVWLYMLWNRVGRERDYVVPRTLSVIPNKARTPWIVNLVFKKGVSDFDEDAFHATLLDLHINEKIKVTPEGDAATIEILDDSGLDMYEAKIVKFLRSISPDGVVTPHAMEAIAENGKHSRDGAMKLYGVQSKYDELTSGTNDSIAKEFTVDGREKLFRPAIVCIVGLILVGIGASYSSFSTWTFLMAGGYGLLAILQLIIAGIFPSTLFGYWRNDNLREKLQWDAFRRHLTDFSQLERYGPEDMNMWGPWLVYGTSLGVGDKVAEAMEMLQVDYAPRYIVPTYYYWFRPITSARTYYGSGRSGGRGGFGGGGGGGFGGGGGMGGGGGGVR